jgi:hypothetical protein
MSQASRLIKKLKAINESTPPESQTLKLDEMSMEDVANKVLQFARAHYPGIASKLKIKSDGKDMWVEIPGNDRTYCVLDLNSGNLQVL